MTNYIIAVYSKFQTKKSIKEAIKVPEFAKNPLIDLQHPSNNRYGTPNEIKQHNNLNHNRIYVTNRTRSWFGQFIYNEKSKKWSFK